MKRLVPVALILLLFAGCSSSGMMTREQAQNIRSGMTKQQIIQAYGKPARVNTTRVEGKVREQWVYATAESMAGMGPRVYVYFENEEVVGVQY